MPKNEGASLDTGACYSYMRVKGVGSVAGLYAPAGFQYINEYGLSIGLEAAAFLGFSHTYVWGALRMGWYFY